MALFPAAPRDVGAAVVRLDDERELLLLLTIHGSERSQHALPRGPVQDLRLKWGVLAVDLKRTDVT